ncbi:CynX/NimT family MFS transporter [Bacillaceae bacterium W0354]
MHLSANRDNNLRKFIFILGIILVAFNLRPSITAVGPLISDIRLDTGISNGVAGLLTTLPLLAFAFLSPFAPRIGQKFGNELTVLFGLILLCAGIFIRPTDIIFLLFFGTILVGAGVAICNVLLPGIVKRRFPAKVGLMTGIYTMAMSSVASAGSGFSVPLAHGLDLGWKWTLAVWGFLVIIAMIIWLPQLKKKNRSEKLPEPDPSDRDIWKSNIAWKVTLFMGLQSMLFFSVVAWLPEILIDRNFNQEEAGWMVSIVQMVGLPSALLAPIIADKLPNQRSIVATMGTLYFVGLSLLLLVNGNYFILSISILFIGLSQGAGIGLSLTFISLRARNPQQAANLSGMAQSVGYFLAAIGPFMVGIIFDWFASWNISIVILVIVSLLMTYSGLGAGKNEYVMPEKMERTAN